MEKSIAKKDTKEKGQSLVKDKPKSTKASRLTETYSTQRSLITPCNLPTIMRTNSKIQTPDLIKASKVLFSLSGFF
jgi:hypothetical protein